MVVTLAVFGIVAMPQPVSEFVAPPASHTAGRQVTTDDSAEQQYLEAMDPYLSVVIGEGKRLAELGNARSRNVLELSVRMDRFREASADLQAFIASHEPPDTLKGTITTLKGHLASAEAAVETSIEAIRGFDWDSVGAAVDQFTTAITAIEMLTSES